MARTRIETRARARALQALYAWDMRDAQKQGELDAELSDVTTNWRMERIGAVERCVLRMAAAELTIGETPPRVVIQEAVTLAERFGSAHSAKFVNGVLDALARRMGRM